MSDEIEVLVELLTDVLGKHKQHYESKGQISFDCPVCAEEKGLDRGDGKGNLEINYSKHVYKCWVCGESEGTQGPLGKLFDKHGTKAQKKLYNLIKPEELKKEDLKRPKLRLPEGYTTFKDSNARFIPHIEAMRYLTSRGITDEIIEKYQIGYTVSGDFAYRVIVPSFDKNNRLNYFIARSWVPNKMKYKNPTAAKDEIIFNESRIDWFKDIYLVEGAFDGFFLDNSIAMLGKKMSSLLFETLYENALGKIIICLDEDAWEDAFKLYHELNGGRLYNKIKIIKPPKDMDVADLKGQIDEYYYEIK
jgi:DNA primase